MKLSVSASDNNSCGTQLCWSISWMNLSLAQLAPFVRGNPPENFLTTTPETQKRAQKEFWPLPPLVQRLERRFSASFSFLNLLGSSKT